jgi:hypothetical protein
MPPDTLCDFDEWIECTGIHVASLRTDECRARQLPENAGQLERIHAALLVGCHFDGTAPPQAEHLERSKDRHV